ncbi:hypothetical protein GQ600_22190 [Phytophthora cactorum]|nr:hypothetical protein GQ600_22190 [Phytophthora cactorum]
MLMNELKLGDPERFTDMPMSTSALTLGAGKFRSRSQIGAWLLSREYGSASADHCFVVRLVRGRLLVYDGYEEDDDPPCVMGPVEHLLWIDCVNAIYRHIATQ